MMMMMMKMMVVEVLLKAHWVSLIIIKITAMMQRRGTGPHELERQTIIYIYAHFPVPLVSVSFFLPRACDLKIAS